MEFQRIGSLVCEVGESPLWSEAEQAWYWVDIEGRAIWRHQPAGGALRCWHAPEMVACITLAADGGMIAGMQSGIFRLALGTGEQAEVTRLVPVNHARSPMRFNDGRCDRQGRFWCGSMFTDMAAELAVGRLYRYSGAQDTLTPFVDNLIVQNGLAWSPDGRTMYLSDSHPRRRLIWEYDFDPDDGVPSNARIFADMRMHGPGRPDGAAMDVDGCYWTCANDGGAVLRFTPQGKLDRSLSVPMAKPSMCAFGGLDRDVLLVTSIAANRRDDDLWAGAVITLDPGVQGMPETPFRA
ncbi:SMP-30/gluconolactonase/LRE family protein [Roseateles sp.]|uniref:SMP-30/gluconolactonase/LRE family protein n=1 Tax=Roseateles sp. TaxID=1971397 RepID=UPI0025DEA199|nr:SMP-30/gluconolactonase/LRE family protein [Roseateles sp.]MBV8037222.1 SMP-30/gluconolactonase/LRE family protein [Roseateles sp.]